MYINNICKGKPLKNIGFQKKNGTNPHFKKIEKTIINHGTVILTVSQKLLAIIK